MYKKRDARANLLFCFLNLLVFFTFSLPSASLDLKVPIAWLFVAPSLRGRRKKGRGRGEGSTKAILYGLYSVNSNGPGRTKVVHTHRISCWRGWPGGFGALSEILVL